MREEDEMVGHAQGEWVLGWCAVSATQLKRKEEEKARRLGVPSAESRPPAHRQGRVAAFMGDPA